jgi:hypothetical protein
MTREFTLPTPQPDGLLEFPGVGRGREVLRVAPAEEGGYRILSVPVCVEGLSRGARVSGEHEDGQLRFREVLEASPGATVRCTVSPACTTRQFEMEYVREGGGPRLGLGPVSIVEPSIVAVHVADRAHLPHVTAYLDRLILAGVLSTWTYGDPSAHEAGRPSASAMAEWELVHPPAV